MNRASFFRWSVLSLLLAVFCLGQEAMFVPEVTGAGQGNGAGTLEVRFKVRPGSYVYEESVTVSLSAGKAVLKESDKAVDYQGDMVFRKDFRRVYEVTGVSASPVKVTLGYQGCLDSGVCLMPEKATFQVSFGGGDAVKGVESVEAPAVSRQPAPSASPSSSSSDSFRALASGFEVIGNGTGYMSKEDFIDWVDRVESGQGGASDERDNVLFRVFHSYGLWLAMLLILPLGLMLNLTPCVLPMIPVNLAIIGAGAKDGRRGHGFVQGLAYGVGMAVSYGLLGVVVVLTGSQFGALNSSGWFNVGVAIVFVLLGLAMFDVFSIDLSRFRQGSVSGGGQSKGKLAGAFLLGALSAVLAGACVAPVLIWVLVLSADLYSSGNGAGLVLPFMLGVGMALPWPILGAGLSKIPRPGMWMVLVRQLFGVLILGLALYYGYTGYRQFAGAAPAEMAAGWTDDLKAGMKAGLEKGRPVLIDFWGISCKNCILMDKEVFPDQSVKDRLAGFEKVKFLADDLSDPLVAEAVKLYGVKGFPTFVVLRPKAVK